MEFQMTLVKSHLYMNDMYVYINIDLNICSALFIDEYAYATLG